MVTSRLETLLKGTSQFHGWFSASSSTPTWSEVSCPWSKIVIRAMRSSRTSLMRLRDTRGRTASSAVLFSIGLRKTSKVNKYRKTSTRQTRFTPSFPMNWETLSLSKHMQAYSKSSSSLGIDQQSSTLPSYTSWDRKRLLRMNYSTNKVTRPIPSTSVTPVRSDWS